MTLREAAMTDCLSTCWRHLWENVDHLCLDTHKLGMQVAANSNNIGNSDFWNSEAKKFVRKVNELLHRRHGNGVKTFKVKFPLNSVHASELDHWVASAVASRTERLILSLGFPRFSKRAAYVLPLKHFADGRGCRLRVLSLSRCILETPPANLNGFSLMSILLLYHVQVVDDVILSIIIHAKKLACFSYVGHKVDIKYEHAPVLCELNAFFEGEKESPLDCIGAFAKLQTLSLQLPSRLQVSGVLQHSVKFAALKEIMLCILTSWKKSICFVAYLLTAAPLVETLKLEVHGNLRPPNNLKIRWPKKFTPTSLSTIRIGVFSGESELLQLVFFLLRRSPVLKTLLVDTHRSHY
ncbi:hypothetical protein ACP4OV_013427 [Aristida adscensionis]